MGYLDNTTTTVDAILKKKGRELLARGENEFNITKFALSDDEIDYTLWDVTHPDGTNSYGAVIENMPVLEAFPDENQVMRYKLVSLPKDTAKLPIIEVPQSSILFKNAGVVQPITPTTRNGSDSKLGYSIILHNSDAADLVVAQGGEVVSTGATTPVFLSDTERKKSITVVGTSFNLISRSTSSTIVTQATIHGNETGATIRIPVTVNANS